MNMAVSTARLVYSNLQTKRFQFISILIIALFIIFLFDIMTGPAWLHITDVLKALFMKDNVSPRDVVIVRLIRLPVALMAIIVGASLGLAGQSMQTILDNPLASPYTLGISAAAGFGAGLAIVLGIGLTPQLIHFMVPVNAFIFSMATCLVIHLLVKVKKADSETIILTGIALLFLFNALNALLQYKASLEDLQALVFWLFGSLLKASWIKVKISLLVFIIIAPCITRDSWRLTALRLGDEKAASLGVNVESLRLRTMFFISVLTATAVCFVGTIGFIGLVSPHIARFFVGEDHRFLTPASALCGAFLLSSASLGSKIITPGAIYPVGIITAFIGVPFFASIIIGKRKNFW